MLILQAIPSCLTHTRTYTSKQDASSDLCLSFWRLVVPGSKDQSSPGRCVLSESLTKPEQLYLEKEEEDYQTPLSTPSIGSRRQLHCKNNPQVNSLDECSKVENQDKDEDD